jgi:capsular exopolysaccharide synthesis family protein
MSSPERPSSPLPTGFVDQPVDAQRYLGALRRDIWLIATIVIVTTVAVFAISLALPKTYRASVDIVYNPTATLQSNEATSTQRQLATFEALVQTPPVTTAAAHKLAESPKAVKDAISASANPNANLLTVTASARKGSVAAARANAVAQAFLSEEQSTQNLGLNNARAQLQAQIAQLRGTPGAIKLIAALEERISALQINAAGTASELQIAESAAPPSGASSPRPTLNALVALFASLLISVLIVLGRDQLRPRFTTPREFGQTLNLPVLAGVPYRRRSLLSAHRRRALSGLEYETYDALQATMRLLGPANDRQDVLLITSATHGEGKTTVAASLARSLSRAGQKTLVISGDLRSPTLHEHFGLQPQFGFSDCLIAMGNDAQQPDEALDRAISAAPGELNLDVLNSGQVPLDPAALLSSSALDRVFEALRQRDYDYVLIDSPPILGLGDAQFLARQSDDVLVVARLDRVSPGQAEDLRDLLKRLQLNPIGMVVMGARVELSPYYLSEHTRTQTAS